ncbi:hypothetical protein MPER_08276 [Moniliophthora perniciosa FA553]|nr:hypothetical protein MPER_08276 [Moniliophthora perniciosa FA553]
MTFPIWRNTIIASHTDLRFGSQRNIDQYLSFTNLKGSMNFLFTPNHELSRLTYYASNHPDKIAKLGSELEKRLRNECRKARLGNMRMRSKTTLDASSNDLEISARAASVFTAWTTYTDGHLIGTDSSLTKNYISCLRHFAALASSQEKDVEIRNR